MSCSLAFRVGQFRVVTEPHGNLPDLGYTCDALIMPVVSQRLLGYPLVNGVPEAVRAAQQLRPKVFFPLENGVQARAQWEGDAIHRRGLFGMQKMVQTRFY